MYFDVYKSILLSDTLIPDIFFCDIMPMLPSECVKIYLHCVFLSKYNKQATPFDIAKKLDISEEQVKTALIKLEQDGLITLTNKGVTLIDLKEQAINRIYRKKTTSSVEDAVNTSKKNKRRNQCIDSINKMFFQGIMSPTWYTSIDNLFESYKFDEDVMVSLFKYCYDNNGLNIKYVEQVAQAWNKKNITTHFELESYLEYYQKLKSISHKIRTALRLNRSLTQYEEELVDVWISKFGYGFNVIELALKKTLGKNSPSLKYVHAILEKWNGLGLKTYNEVVAYDSTQNYESKQKKMDDKVPQQQNFEQRSYDSAFFEKLKNTAIKSDADKK